MFFNLKYHIASLIAVFLSLGLGMLIGTTVPLNDTLNSKHQQLTASLEMHLTYLKQSNEQLVSQIKVLEDNQKIQHSFENYVLPILVENKLEGKTIAIIGTSGKPTDYLQNLLIASGANIHSSTVFNDNSINLYNKEELRFKRKKTFTENIAETVSEALLKNNYKTLTALSELGIINFSYGDEKPLDIVVITGGSYNEMENNISNLDYPIIDYFFNNNILVFGVEESSVTYSYIKDYQKKKIPTVDNIDTIPGQVSLVFSLADNNYGQYGVKPTAQMLMPKNK